MNDRKIRILLGVAMFYSFIALAFFINFVMRLDVSSVGKGLALAVLWYMWCPALALIVQNYFLLTRVFKSE